MAKQGPLRRATRWDGVFPIPHDGEHITPEDLRTVVRYVTECRGTAGAFAVVLADHDGDRSSDRIEAYARAGLTWWIQRIHEPWTGSLEETKAVIRQGPPGT